MKKTLILVAAALLFAGCIEHEEIEFEGVVVGTRNCSGALMDSNTGFLVKLTRPEGIGGSMTSAEGETMENIIVLYEPPKLIYVEDRIHGTFYRDDKYSRGNCTIRWPDMNLPEGVFLRVYVD